MGKLFTTCLVAVSLVGLSACAKADETAGNAAEAGVETGNLVDDSAALGNDVTAVDGDAAPANGLDGAALPAEGNAADATGNAADPLTNGS